MEIRAIFGTGKLTANRAATLPVLRLHRPADQLDREVGNSKSRAEC